ncbi:MAG: type II secretion system F family protein [Actinobacteria bacterium]|nr:type II secretion system F family protein [Actinomycetota bacterium]
MELAVLVPVLLLATSLGAIIVVVVNGLTERAGLRQSLRQVTGPVVENERDRELLDPLRQRAIDPFFAGLTSLGRRLTPVGYVEKVRRKFLLAGISDQRAVDRFLAIRAATVVAAVVVVVVLLLGNVLGLSGLVRVAVPGLLAAVLVLGPDSWINKRVEARQREIQTSLPDVLDLLVISVEAGLGFEQAMDRVIHSVPGPLSDEFARVLGETRAGAARADAMRAMDDRCGVGELRSFVMSIIQADTFGVSIGRVLRSQAEEMRVKRRQNAEERAQKAPVKMLIPMVFCIFPALFAIILGPAVINMMTTM